MRQRITIEQLNELSEQGKKKYEKLFPAPTKIEYASIHGTRYIRYMNGSKKGIVALLSIGQMIEFLGYKWEIAVLNDGGREGQWVTYPKDLCNALWEAVKEVLEELK